MSRFRLSNHNLMIEKGRHFKPIIKREERLCPFCKIVIEDEEHFLLSCLFYSPLRTILESVCRKNCNTYDSLSRKQKFIYIMSNEDQNILEALSTFITDSLNLRDKIINYFFTWINWIRGTGVGKVLVSYYFHFLCDIYFDCYV